MKNLFIAIFALSISIFSSPARAQSGAEEYEAVIRTLNYYLEGGTNNSFETLSKGFHPNATMKFIGNDGFKEVNALEFFKGGIKPGPPQNRKTKIVSVDISGVAAQAKLEIEYETFYFIDYMQLLKIDGDWKITGKIFYRKPKQ